MNFQELAEKLKRIDEGIDTSVEECGMGMPSSMMPNQAPPQQDTVSMNVSMNAQGKGGIRDLMNVLKDIQDGAGGDSDVISTEPHGIEIDADPEADIAMPPKPEPGFDDADDEIEIVHMDKEENEEYSNTPEPEYQSQDYMHNTISGSPQQMHKGNSPNADNILTMAAILPVAAGMVRENLKSRLQDHYNNIKEDAKHVMMRSGPGARMTRYDKTDPDPAHQKHRKDTADAIKKHRATGKDLEVDGLDQKVDDKTLYRYDTKRVEKQ